MQLAKQDCSALDAGLSNAWACGEHALHDGTACEAVTVTVARPPETSLGSAVSALPHYAGDSVAEEGQRRTTY